MLNAKPGESDSIKINYYLDNLRLFISRSAIIYYTINYEKFNSYKSCLQFFGIILIQQVLTFKYLNDCFRPFLGKQKLCMCLFICRRVHESVKVCRVYTQHL